MTEQRRLPSDKVPETSREVPSEKAPETSRGVPSDKVPETSQEKIEKRDRIIRTMNSIIKNKTTRNLLAVLASTLLLLSASIEQREKPDSRRWEKGKEVATYTLEASVVGTTLGKVYRNLEATSENEWKLCGVLADAAKKLNDTAGVNRLMKELGFSNDESGLKKTTTQGKPTSAPVVPKQPSKPVDSKEPSKMTLEEAVQEATSYQGAGSKNNPAVTNPNDQGGKVIGKATVPADQEEALGKFLTSLAENNGLTADGTATAVYAENLKLEGKDTWKETNGKQAGTEETSTGKLTADKLLILRLKNGMNK